MENLVAMRGPFQDIFKGKRVLITGDTGFKGSWLAIWLNELGAEVFGYALPPKSESDNYITSNVQNKISHQDGDVCDLNGLTAYMKKINPEIAFHLAAQSLVLYSYENPVETFATNLMGAVNFLEAVRVTPSVKVAINVTSDKCYENKDWVWGYRENDPMGGKDPYSASKGCSELITSSYNNSYFSNGNSAHVASARAGNVIGGGDWARDRIIPDFFRAFLDNKELIIRNPEYTRPWQHVLEPLSGYLQLASKLYSEGKLFSGSWNFGPLDNNHYSVKKLILSTIDIFGKGGLSAPVTEKSLHEAHLLKLDISKAMKHLQWQPVMNFKETVSFTVKGYEVELDNKDVYHHRIAQINEYTSLAIERQIAWAIQ